MKKSLILTKISKMKYFILTILVLIFFSLEQNTLITVNAQCSIICKETEIKDSVSCLN